MKTKIVKQYTILYQFLLLLKEPTYIFLIQVLQHLSPARWWEEYIEPVLQLENKENFKYLDISDLLNVFKMNWENIFRYLDKQYHKFKYDEEYKLENRVHKIRTIVAHANDIDMSPLIFTDCLSNLSDYSKLIKTDAGITHKLEAEWRKSLQDLPSTGKTPLKNELIKENILSIIENKVLLEAINCMTLPQDIKLSIDRTTLRLQSMRTIEEIMGFFNNAMLSDRGIAVQKAMHKEGLLCFDDIKEEINNLYKEAIIE
jgi:hypothetical protein